MRVLSAAFEMLLRLRAWGGSVYGSEDLCLFLYALARREKPRCVVELGTGLGITALWIAQALRENGRGHLWTVDDGRDYPVLRAKIARLPNISGRSRKPIVTYAGYLTAIRAVCGLRSFLTFVDAPIDFPGIVQRIPALRPPRVDWVFSDFAHGPEAVLAVVGTFLPHLTSHGSIFLDSVSAYRPAKMMLDRLIAAFNQGNVPPPIRDRLKPAQLASLKEMVQAHRFQAVHLFEAKQRRQNSTAWLRLEPRSLATRK